MKNRRKNLEKELTDFLKQRRKECKKDICGNKYKSNDYESEEEFKRRKKIIGDARRKYLFIADSLCSLYQQRKKNKLLASSKKRFESNSAKLVWKQR